MDGKWHVRAVPSVDNGLETRQLQAVQSLTQFWISDAKLDHGIVDSSSFARPFTDFSLFFGAATKMKQRRGRKHTNRKPKGRRIFCSQGPSYARK